MMRKIRRAMSEKKGFTLVELVVVLVILAILAALLMPSLTGYIDKAKEKRVVAEVHQVVTAAQSLADEAYALAAENLDAGTYEDVISVTDIEDLAEIKGTLNTVMINVSTGKVEYVELELSGITGYYTPEGGIVTDDAPTLPDQTSTAYATIPSDSGEFDPNAKL